MFIILMGVSLFLRGLLVILRGTRAFLIGLRKMLIKPPILTIDFLRHPIKYFRALSSRKGYCKKCGSCCRNCYYQTLTGCKLGFFRPVMCRLYPNNGVDKLKLYDSCGYYWDKKP